MLNSIYIEGLFNLYTYRIPLDGPSPIHFFTAPYSEKKRERRFRCGFLYVYAATIAGLSLIALLDFSFWLCALILGLAHLIIDGFEACVRKNSLLLGLK